MDDYSSSSFEDFLFMLLVGLFLAEIVIGAVHIFGALIRTIICINTNKPIGKLKTYWIMVGIYFLIFAGLYFGESFILNTISINSLSDSNHYMDELKLYQYFMCAHIFWICIAWGIAVWYWIKIVFAKSKKEPISIINESL